MMQAIQGLDRHATHDADSASFDPGAFGSAAMGAPQPLQSALAARMQARMARFQHQNAALQAASAAAAAHGSGSVPFNHQYADGSHAAAGSTAWPHGSGVAEHPLASNGPTSDAYCQHQQQGTYPAGGAGAVSCHEQGSYAAYGAAGGSGKVRLSAATYYEAVPPSDWRPEPDG